MSSLPFIGELNGVQTLFVDDAPFFVLGGELHNSSSSSTTYMEEKVWPNLRGLNMNTVVLPVAWEMVEAEDGVFDFSLVDGLLAQARREGMRLVFLWFGLWKNSESSYVPGWMKRDAGQFFRVEDADGKRLNIVSPFCKAAVARDAQAFERLMAHLRVVDGEDHTVIMVQVENEIGVLGAERDFSKEAQRLYDQQVPEDVLTAYGRTDLAGQGWEAAFGADGPELFMAWGYATAVEQIAAMGRAIYPLPMYVNAWLVQHPWRPGTYPCGGPVMKVKKMWKHCAPSLFTMAPDIYDPHTADVMDEYACGDNPLFIPEIRKDPVCASYMFYAFGKHNAIGISPFGIEDLLADPADFEKPPMFVLMELNIDVSAMDGSKTAPYLAAAYGMMAQLMPLYMDYRNTPKLQAFVQREINDNGIWLKFSKYDMVISYKRRQEGGPVGAGMIFELAPDKFLCVGMNYKFDVYPKAGSRSHAVVGQAQEGIVQNGQFVRERVLNGDERMNISLNKMPSALLVEIYDL